MILVAIAALSLVVLGLVISAFGAGIPALPADVVSMINDVLGVFRMSVGVLLAYVHPGPIRAALGVTVAALTIYKGYKLVMWVVKKIPMFGVSE